MENMSIVVQEQHIESKIYEIRGRKIMLDFDLAELYGVETRTLKQAVKRNIERFPADFIFQLTKSEWQELITNCDKFSETIKHTPVLPVVFTEQGVAMLAGILKSKTAIQVNIAIMRAFVLMRQYALSHRDLTEKMEELERQCNQKFRTIGEAIDYLLTKDKQDIEQRQRKRIGYKTSFTPDE